MIERTSNYQQRQPSLTDRIRNGARELMGVLSPRYRMEQAAADMVQEELTSYRNARHTRTSGRKIPTEGRADYHLEVGYDRRELVDRARQLERNSVIAAAMLDRATENVVGNGFQLQCHSKNKLWNEDVEQKWREWCKSGADVRGLNSLGELSALAFRSWLRDGDVGTIKLADGSVQMIESDQIANPMGNIPTRDQIDGINLDARGKPTSYLVVKDPDPMWASVRFGQEFVEVPAKDMIFLARRQRLGQTRGISAFNNCSWLLDQIDGMIEATTVAARMAACVGLVIQRQHRASGLTSTVDSQGNSRRGMQLEPGMIAEVGQGDNVTTVNPHQPNQNFADYIATLGRITALNFGLPLEVAFLDFSRTNYSSARAALLQAYQIWETQQAMMECWYTEIFKWWLMREIRAGRITARRDALKHSWVTPTWAWIDPDKELKAHLAAIDAGLDTHTRVAASQGRDFEKMQQKRKEEDDLKRSLDLPITRSPMTRDEMPEPTAGSEDESGGESGAGGAFGDKPKKDK
jgi:lambda family phage portal protein